MAKVTPDVVPAPVCVIKVADEEVAVVALVVLFKNLKVKDPETLNEVAVPLNKAPSPNNCASAEEVATVLPEATLV